MTTLTANPAPVNSASVVTTATRPADVREQREWLKIHWAGPALEAPPEIPAGNARDGWPAWTDADRWAPTEDGRAESWDAERFEPTAEESAELAEDDAEYDAHLDRLAAERLEAAFAEFDAWQDAHPDELVRALGCIEARKLAL